MGEIITAINAKPETIQQFLTNSYVIPDYQRPYSWDEEQCSKLWEDISEFFDVMNDEDAPYFLGNVVVYNENKKRIVVDGQQRLITLNLLVKALLQNNGTYGILEKCLYQYDPLTEKIEDPKQIRIDHNVLGDSESSKLEDILLNNFEDENSRYYKNYQFFDEKFREDTRHYDAKQKEELITAILYKIVILPIECTSFENALTIFETINNRGMDLSDADIFKSKLYKNANAGTQKEDFINQWNEISSNLEKDKAMDFKKIFTQLMHVIRGKENITENIVGLRKFYDQEKSRRLSDWQDVLNSMKKLIGAWDYITISKENGGASNKILNWVTILRHYPNSYWEYPIMTFIHKNSIINKDDEFLFDNEKEKELLDLLEVTTKYCYFKWLKYRTIGSVKDTIFKVVRDISQAGNYKKTFYDDIKDESIYNDLDKNNLGKGQKGICLLNAILCETRGIQIPEGFHIEHILPKKWERYNYPDWNDNTYKNNHERLGNLLVLEGGKNIKVGNKPFADKKLEYQQSTLTETRDISIKYSNWSHRDFKLRDVEIMKRLERWFLDKT